MKDYFEYQGNFEIPGSRDAVREANKNNIINDAKIWMKMIETRNLTSNTYVQQTAENVIVQISQEYINQFNDFEQIMIKIQNDTF
jgi:nucleotidyltransferase substrate binding protein (TIGR01987 family)